MTLTPGVITSPNHPAHYPSNLEKTEQVVVESGKILRLEFAHFDVESKDDGTCPYDYVTIKNGDGNTLMEKTCGSSLPAAITSTSNTVEIHFHTDGSVSKSGWRLTWRAVTPGA